MKILRLYFAAVLSFGVLILTCSNAFARDTERAKTTSPSLALQNLNSQVATLEQLLADSPQQQSYRTTLFDLISTRTQLLGMYFDFAHLERLANQSPRTVEGALLRARYLSAIHEFRAALNVLSALDENNPEVWGQVARAKLALREEVPALIRRHESVLATRRTYSNLMLMAELQAEVGNFDASDSYFAAAFERYRDASPFPLAYLFFRRGVMWGEKAGDDSLALEHYTEAVHYLPQYVNAQVHRAELLSTTGNIQSAIDSLRSVADSTDPEPNGLLGELLIKQGLEAEGQEQISIGAMGYDELLRKYPLGFVDHASEFFAGPGGDPKRALTLARRNLENRRTERSYLVALEAASKVDSLPDVCRFAAEALELQPVFVPLLDLLEGATAVCN